MTAKCDAIFIEMARSTRQIDLKVTGEAITYTAKSESKTMNVKNIRAFDRIRMSSEIDFT